MDGQTDRQTDRQTDSSDFIGPSIGQGSNERKKFVKVQPFNLAKVQCLYGHMKPTIRDMGPKNIILHHLTNDVNSEKNPCQIPRLIIDLAVLLETNTNNIAISLYMTLSYPYYPITPHNNDLNNTASEVNNLLVYMCGERHIPVIRHSQTIHPDTLLVKMGSI